MPEPELALSEYTLELLRENGRNINIHLSHTWNHYLECTGLHVYYHTFARMPHTYTNKTGVYCDDMFT